MTQFTLKSKWRSLKGENNEIFISYIQKCEGLLTEQTREGCVIGYPVRPGDQRNIYYKIVLRRCRSPNG